MIIPEANQATAVLLQKFERDWYCSFERLSINFILTMEMGVSMGIAKCVKIFHYIFSEKDFDYCFSVDFCRRGAFAECFC